MEDLKSEAKQQLEAFFGNAPIMFLKFADNRTRLQQIREGSLYMNNLKFYIDRELDAGEAGLGDKLEALNTINDVEISITDSQTNELLVTVPAISANLRYNEALTKPVFCLYAVTIDMIEVIEVNGDQVKCRLKFSSEELERMIETFGEYVLVIMAHPFMERIQRDFEEKQYKYRAKMVEYADYSVNDMERIRKHIDGKSDLFFYKEKGFAHQKEFRIVIFNKDIEQGYSEPIPSIKNASNICSTYTLGNDNGIIWTVTRNYDQ